MAKKALPPRPDLGWLRKRSKDVLARLRSRDGDAKLSEAQRVVAREHGFQSWRALKQHVEAMRAGPAEVPDIAETVVAEFFEKVGVGDRERVEEMLREDPRLVHAVGPHPFWGGRPQALHVSIDTNRPEMTKLLIRAGADINGRNAEYAHWSPLLLAIGKKRHNVTRMLLRRGAKIGLVEALALGDDDKVLRLLKRGLPDNVPNDGSLLMFARTPAAIDRLLALGVSTTAKDQWGATPMEALSRMGRRGKPLVRHLHSKGIPVGPEMFARMNDRKTLARLIAHDPAVLRNPLVIKAAVDFGHHALARWLLERGADPNARSGNTADETCLHSAAWNGDLAMVEILLAHGADPFLRDRQYEGFASGWAEVSVEVTNNPACADVATRLKAAEQSASR